MIPARIVEGKKKLDIDTRHNDAFPAPACRSAAPAALNPDGSARLDITLPLPLVRHLSYRRIAGANLWIGVKEGVAIVLDDAEHTLLQEMAEGVPPAHAGRADQADAVNRLLGRLGAAGFVRGIEGYVDEWIPAPGRFMRIHLTRLCNLACKHCYADSSPFVDTSDQMATEDWLRVIDDFAAAGGERILYTGGEALTHPDCALLLRRSRACGLNVTLFSNGVLIGRHLDLIRETVDQVQISIDGPDARTNDPIRGVGTFKRAYDAVEMLLEAGVPVRVSMVVMEENIADIRARFLPFARDWTARGVDWRLGYGVAHHGRGDEIGDTYEIQDVRPVVDALLEELRGSQGPVIARRTTGCGYAEQIVVAPDGAIHPCHLLDGKITHVKDQPMTELIQRLEATSRDYSVDNTEGCNRCDIRHLCGGGCRIQNGKTIGNRRVANCTAQDKLHRLENLVDVFNGAFTG